VNYRPYPDVDRALNQVERGAVRHAHPVLAFIDEAMHVKLTDWQKAFVEAWAKNPLGALHAKQAGRRTVADAVVDQAVEAGEHVHVAGRDGVHCAGGDDTCTLPRIERGDHIVIDHDGRSSRYEVTDIAGRGHPARPAPGLNLTLRAVDGTTEPERCGFVHDLWLDGIYRARRRCTAPAGHTDGQFAYDHGPWETVPEPER
jgi:hypothetical protein